jgi:hypothetical protein
VAVGGACLKHHERARDAGTLVTIAEREQLELLAALLERAQHRAQGILGA